MRRNATEAGKRVVFLNICSQENLLAVLVHSSGERTDIRPFLAIANLEVIGLACFKASKVCMVDSAHNTALRIGAKL